MIARQITMTCGIQFAYFAGFDTSTLVFVVAGVVVFVVSVRAGVVSVFVVLTGAVEDGLSDMATPCG
jgi:hypothetical protein